MKMLEEEVQILQKPFKSKMLAKKVSRILEDGG
jgi:hypothetical protein